MTPKRLQLLNIQAGEWKLALPLLLLLAINTLILELSDVVATSGFVSKVGTRQVVWLWIADMVITVLSAGAYALIVDRMPRVRLVGWLLGGFALLYLLLQLLFLSAAPDWLKYPLLYVLADQQYVIFPLAFWALAGDLYTTSESQRLFPIIAAGAALGSVLGNGLAAGAGVVFETRPQNVSLLLSLGVLLFLVAFVLLRLLFRGRTVRARQARETGARVKETVQVGFDVIWNVPLFRYLGLAMLLVGLAFTIVEYHFLFSVDRSFTADPLKFQTFYGAYKAALIAATWLLQWLVTGRLLRRVQLRSAFVPLPAALIAAAGGALAIPGIIGGAGGRFLGRLVQRAWDEPARKSVEGLVPDERRGRVSAFVDSYGYAAATIVGSLLLGGLFLASSLGWLPERAMIAIYLGVATCSAAAGLWSSLRLRAVYDQSLLNWRLARSRRKSVLDGIEF